MRESSLDGSVREAGWSRLARLALEKLRRPPAPDRPAAGEPWQPEVLRDDGLQARFEAQGFVRLPAVPECADGGLFQQAFELLPDHVRTPGDAKAPYHCTFMHADGERRRRVQALFRSVFEAHVRTHLKGYRILHAAIHVKPAGGGDLPLHTNWSSVADLNRSTVTLWCPLSDVGEHNGTLEVVPGSHRLTRRIEDRVTHYFQGFHDLLMDMCVPQVARSGEVLLLEDTIIHGSRSNASPDPRIAVQVVCVPEDATPVYYHSAAPDLFEVIEADSDFYTRFDLKSIKTRNPAWKGLGFVRKATDDITAGEFLRRLRDPSEIRSRGFRLQPAVGHGGLPQ